MKTICLFVLCLSMFFYACEKNSQDKTAYEKLIGVWQLDSVKYKQANMVKPNTGFIGKNDFN